MKSLKDVTVGEWIETCDQRKEEHDRLQHVDPCFNCTKRYLADTLIDIPNFYESSAKSLDKVETSKIDKSNSIIDNHTYDDECDCQDTSSAATD